MEGAKLIQIADKEELYGAVEFHKRWDRSNLILKDKFQNGELGLPINCWVEYSQRKSVPIQFLKLGLIKQVSFNIWEFTILILFDL